MWIRNTRLMRDFSSRVGYEPFPHWQWGGLAVGVAVVLMVLDPLWLFVPGDATTSTIDRLVLLFLYAAIGFATSLVVNTARAFSQIRDRILIRIAERESEIGLRSQKIDLSQLDELAEGPYEDEEARMEALGAAQLARAHQPERTAGAAMYRDERELSRSGSDLKALLPGARSVTLLGITLERFRAVEALRDALGRGTSVRFVYTQPEYADALVTAALAGLWALEPSQVSDECRRTRRTLHTQQQLSGDELELIELPLLPPFEAVMLTYANDRRVLLYRPVPLVARPQEAPIWLVRSAGEGLPLVEHLARQIERLVALGQAPEIDD